MKLKTLSVATMIFLAAIAVSAADKKISKDKLPAAVQKTADEQSKGATVVGFSTEQEKGQTLYEASLKVDGHSKDVVIDASGKVVEIEEEVAFDLLPKDVQAGLTKAAGIGKLGKVESLTKDGKLVAYEAKVMKAGKKSEVQVGPSGEKLKHEE
ncbi:MAG: hypothetical protein JWO13_2429 [Acidobacteriales bacterium]|nr:hypothetical protein [Terriglobales bacterium]